MYISPSTVPVWFPYMFLCYAAGIVGVISLTMRLQARFLSFWCCLPAVKGGIHWMQVFAWLGITVVPFAGGAGLAFLGDINRRFAAQIDFFRASAPRCRWDQGLAESLRLFLGRTCHQFWRGRGLLLYRDTDLERIFLWRLKSGESERLVPESMPLSRTDGFCSTIWTPPFAGIRSLARVPASAGTAGTPARSSPSRAARPRSAGV